MNAQTKIQSPNVYQRLNAARAAFHATKLKKTGKNTFAGYQYFELGDFLVPALKIFAEHGLCATISFSPDLASMRIVNADNPEDWTCITSPMGSAALKGCHEVQNIGAVETYQRRYLWVTALEIVEHDALDATTGRDTGQSEDRTVSPPARGSKHSALQTAVRQFVHTMEGCGDWDEWAAFRDTKESQELIAEVKSKLPQWWDGGPDMPEEFVPLSRRIELLEANLANQIADIARV